MKYVIYFRVSTEEQKTSKLGLEAQEKSCMDHIGKTPGPYVIFKDEAVSGSLRMEEREQLTNAIEELEEGDVLLISSRDRLGRDVVHNAIAEREIEKRGATLFTVNQDDSQLDEGIARMMRTMIDAFAQYERYLASTRTKKALAEKKARGERVGRIPYGQRLNEDNLLEVEPYEAKVLKIMYSYRVHDKLSFREIADRLNGDGYRNRKDTLWTHGATCRVYSNYLQILDGLLSLKGDC